MHITPDVIEYADGSATPTGNVENIKRNGFLPGDSNVGGFLKTGEHYSNVGQPGSFKNPEDFLKSYIMLLKHYLYHAVRTNHRNSATSVEKKITAIKPAFILINGNLKVEHGTDYEDHFILRNGSRPEDIIGIISADEIIDVNDAESIANNYAELLSIPNERLETNKCANEAA